jgi:hypothetical protein
MARVPVTGKKCIPGIICFENMTLFLLFFIGISVVYLYWQVAKIQQRPVSTVSPVSIDMGPIRPNLDDPYVPPLKPIEVRGVVPINIQTSGISIPYQQLGILTRQPNNGSGDTMILPLMGRSLLNGRDKWQYYTLSNTPGAGINTRLPLRVDGRNCSGEYGCDSVSSGDTVYVEGYNDSFRATIYDNAGLSYLPIF